jgi:pyridoxal/pyridoxine/pyridoxamine kinase
MASYWWQCESCMKRFSFPQACNSKGIAHFIRDIILPNGWEQQHLLRICTACNQHSLRIAYEFPRKEKEIHLVKSIVGLGIVTSIYLPMMWETYTLDSTSIMLFDFKYINGRNIRGLNRPAVFSQQDLQDIFKLYCNKNNRDFFP